jgi:hypothetical protein
MNKGKNFPSFQMLSACWVSGNNALRSSWSAEPWSRQLKKKKHPVVLIGQCDTQLRCQNLNTVSGSDNTSLTLQILFVSTWSYNIQFETVPKISFHNLRPTSLAVITFFVWAVSAKINILIPNYSPILFQISCPFRIAMLGPQLSTASTNALECSRQTKYDNFAFHFLCDYHPEILVLRAVRLFLA